MNINELESDQRKQLLNTQQILEAFEEEQQRGVHTYNGSMARRLEATVGLFS